MNYFYLNTSTFKSFLKTQMVATKPVQSLMSLTNIPNPRDDTFLPDPTKYGSIVRGLQYLSLTCPDIKFSVNKLSQFMHHPTSTHWFCVKRLLRYLAGTITHGLLLHKKSPINLHAYLDADLVGNPDDKSSISAHIVFLGHNPMSSLVIKETKVHSPLFH